MADKIYVGNGKQIETKYGKMMKLSFSKDDLNKMVENLSSKGYVNLVLSERKEVGKYGETHSMTVDTWQPEGNKVENGFANKVHSDILKKEIDITDIPF